MKKIFFFLLAIPIILSIIFLAIYDELNVNKFLANIQKDTNLIIYLEDKGKMRFFKGQIKMFILKIVYLHHAI